MNILYSVEMSVFSCEMLSFTDDGSKRYVNLFIISYVQDIRSFAFPIFRGGSQLCWISETFHRHIVIQMIPPPVLVCCVTNCYCTSKPVTKHTAYLSVYGLVHTARGTRNVHSEEHNFWVKSFFWTLSIVWSI